MRKIPLMLAVFVVTVAVLATSAFTLHPLAVRNGIVTSYSAGSTMTIRGSHLDETYQLRGLTSNGSSGAPAGLGVGAHVTVFAECSGPGKGSTMSRSSAPVNNGRNTMDKSDRFSSANSNTCVAVFVIVNQAASTTTTSGSAPAASTTPSGTSAPSGTATPSGGMVTPTPTP